mmetsp:Transcript_17274/g.28377  ORF Transcript_17274/g.28377 Transcript_17274/m.28377 type:complete len:432 (+) Transcript_17274:156-1451(+)|eukprot:CAMPEP_0184658168 /NCGR_PEP_ID=MMETSP0308-20130426/23884_1 /TAXON_ID=38269 /ORGANISM="Gloeochaete witrockiana, Strain SAG 46.84" /LENGTH=431 /DNA_ID=CAMNT_0027096871 /DNA_START=58 /DNA_END=1353 /DNA_ORIENTATION=-
MTAEVVHHEVAFGDALTADTLLICSDAQVCIRVHGSILSSRCPFFGRMLLSGMCESTTKIINLQEVPVDDLCVLLALLYDVHVDWTTMPMVTIVGAASLADRFLMTDIKWEVEAKVSSKLTVENAITCFESAYDVSEHNICAASVRFMAEHWDEILESRGLMTMRVETLASLLGDIGSLIDEIDKFLIIKRWVDFHGGPEDCEVVEIETAVDLSKINASLLRDCVEPSGLVSKDALFHAYRAVALSNIAHLEWETLTRPDVGTFFSISDRGRTAACHSARHTTLLTNQSFRSGQHAWTVRYVTFCDNFWVGVASRMADRSSWLGKQTHGWAYGSNGFICHSTGRDAGPYDTEYGVRFCPGASIRVFLDMDARTLEFAVIRLDGTINRFGVAYSNLPSVVYPAVSLRSPGVATVSDYESIASSFRSSAARAA